MIRKIIQVKIEEYVLHIPREYLNKEIEILILPFENISKTEYRDDILLNKINKTAGILKKRNIDPVKWQNEIRSEWD
jgi:hypothetical protein